MTDLHLVLEMGCLLTDMQIRHRAKGRLVIHKGPVASISHNGLTNLCKQKQNGLKHFCG
jgi:hypothetical protein